MNFKKNIYKFVEFCYNKNMKKFLVAFCLLIMGIVVQNIAPTKLFAESPYNPTNYKFFHFYNENHFYCVNTSSNQIELYQNNETINFGEYGNTDGYFTEIKHFKVLQNGELAVLDSLNRLQFFSSNFTHLKTIQHIKSASSFLSLGNITSVSQDIYSNIYLVDETNGYILKANSSFDHFEIVLSNLSAQNAKIAILNSSSNIVILANNNVTILDKTISIGEETLNIFTDALNYVYVVCPNKIIKLDSSLSLIGEQTISIGTEFTLNQENGKIYYFENNSIVTLENFASDISSFAPPCNVNENSLFASKVEICTLTVNTNLLASPYSNLSEITLTKGEEVILLGITTELYNNFAYVMLVKDSTYSLGYVEEKHLVKKQIEETNYSVIPARQDVNYFKFPCKLIQNLSSPILTYNNNYTVTREITLNNIDFLEIKLNNLYAYVLKAETINSNLNYVKDYLQTNARLKPYSNQNTINIYSNANKDSIIFSSNSEIKVKIIKSYESFTEVSLIANGKIITGFVDNKFIVKDSNFTMPLTIVLILVSLVVLGILIFKFKKELANKNKISKQNWFPKFANSQVL